MSGSNPSYSGSAAEILNVDYAAGWEAITPLTVYATGGATTSVELDSTIRTVILQASTYVKISFTKVATDIVVANDLVVSGHSGFLYTHEFKVPRALVGNDKKSSVYLNIVGHGAVAGTCRLVKG